MTTLTELAPDELAGWHREVVKAAALSGQAALDATDVLIWGIRESAGRDSVPSDRQDASEALDDRAWGLGMVAEDIARLSETVARLRRTMAIPGPTPIWEAQSLRTRADSIGHLAGPEARATAAADIATAKAEAFALADELDVLLHRQQIATLGQKIIANASALPGIVGGIDRAVSELRRLGSLTPEDEAAAVAGKGRAVRYRCDKRLAEAEVVAAGGAIAKAERMRAEAAVLLKQDMAKAFPGA